MISPWGRGANTEQSQKRKYKHLECQKRKGHIGGITTTVSVALLLLQRGEDVAMLTPRAVKRSAMTQGPGCEKEEAPLVPSAYVIFLMGWPWVTNRRNNDVLARSEQLLHGGCDGARWEQQPTGFLPTRGTNIQTASHPHTCSEFHFKTTASPNITTQSLLSDHWSDCPPINLFCLVWVQMVVSGVQNMKCTDPSMH